MSAVKRKSRHKKHIELLEKLVEKTDFYIAHVWNSFGNSMHGDIDSKGRQIFLKYGDCYKQWFTPWFVGCSNKIFFALMRRKGIGFGIVLQGWNELKWFVLGEILKKECNETVKESL